MDNYLPAHPICNNYRWYYGTEEFQWILKLGVWLKTHIENCTAIGQLAARAFCAYERRRATRRRKQSQPTRAAAASSAEAAAADDQPSRGAPLLFPEKPSPGA